ncbi:MAG: 50S ribosomal protein L11 methyltransferase [bacterium]|nr:50S ribosomal protein L11 methyltransferase [bacterium]
MRWIEISVDVPLQDSEMAGDCLLGHCPAGFSESARPGRGRRVLRVYLPSTRAGRSSLSRLRRALAREAASGTIGVRVVGDTDWVKMWRAHAKPVRVGRITVQPTWMRSRIRPGQVLVRLDAGQAFGSGEHPSTQLCLAAVERYVHGGETVLDLGTGSGILAIAAARLGARRVLAIDDDDVAASIARANARANGVLRIVTVRRASGLSRVRLRADLIVANLTPEILAGVFPHVGRCLAPGGRFVGGGFGPARVAEVARLAQVSGLRVVGTEARRGWRAVHAVHAVAGRP